MNLETTELIKLKPTVLRGNASEIISISDSQGGGKGVDSTAESNEALDAAKSLAIKYQIVVAVTGEVDSYPSFKVLLYGKLPCHIFICGFELSIGVFPHVNICCSWPPLAAYSH